MPEGCYGTAVRRLVDRELETVAALRDLRARGECPGCGGSGEIELRLAAGDVVRRPCPLVSRSCLHGTAQWDRARADILKLLRDPGGVPGRFVDGLAGPRRLVTKALSGAKEWTPDGFLVLTGGTGAGKSFAAAHVLSRYLWRVVGDAWARPWEWQSRARDVAHGISWVSPYEIGIDREWAKAIQGAGILVLDDLGHEPAYASPTVAGVIGRRYDDCRPCVVTTNLSLAEIEDRYGAHIAERLAEHGCVVDCGQESLRLAA